MLFNSYVFIFCFLPITLAGFGLLGGFGYRRLGTLWLVACSMFYYGYWSWLYLQLLLISMVVNYLIGAVWLCRGPAKWRKAGLVVGLAFNISVLGYFKYTNLLISTFDALAGGGVPLRNIILPLGISFFTFQKIAYLVDVYKGRGYSRNFLDYSLFVVFFPQLIAGPIVHPREVLPQFSRRRRFGLTARNLSIGLTLFFFGLAKKVLIADSLSATANSIFGQASGGQAPPFTSAWLGALAYTLQIYFDFSGYTDMAIGLARLFGVRLPVNFNSPYKSTSIVDFWRRWHMTLSRFLRDYLYIPLGGNRRGKTRRYANLMITMLLGGLWHGANWTFLFWGGLHGAYLCVNHAFAAIQRRKPADGRARLPPSRSPLEESGSAGASPSLAAPHAVARGQAGRMWAVIWRRGLTLFAVIVAWVFFRADNFHTAGRMLESMAGLHGFGMRELSRSHLRWPMELGLMTFCVALPNTQQVMSLARPALGVLPPPPGRRAGRILWRPTARWAVLIATLAVAAILLLSRPSEFIYYQF